MISFNILDLLHARMFTEHFRKNLEIGFLSFIRLLGTFYFKKHVNGFDALKGHKTPMHLCNSLDPSLQTAENMRN